MATNINHVLVKLALKEILKPAKSHVFEYLKSEIPSSKYFLSSVLTACFEDTPHESEQTIVVGPVEQPSFPHYIPGTDYEYFLAASKADFKNIFRMKRTTIRKLSSIIEKKIFAGSSVIEPCTSIKKKILLTLWLLGNKETFSTAASMFGLTEDSVYIIFNEMCSELTALAEMFIKWPLPVELSQVVETFDRLYGFPGVNGIIGHTHIRIRIPDDTIDKDKYLNTRLKHHTILLQIVVDAHMLILDAVTGFVGSTPVLQAFLHSPIYPRLTSVDNQLICDQGHLLGSADYPQLANLLTPFTYETNQRVITTQEVEFNCLHYSARLVLDQTIKLLKARFRRVKCIDVNQPELASQVVIAACVLHNFAIIHGDEFNE